MHSAGGGRFDAHDPEKRIRLLAERQAGRLRECVAKIRAISQQAHWERIVSLPFLKNDKVEGSLFDIKRVGKNIRLLLRHHNFKLND